MFLLFYLPHVYYLDILNDGDVRAKTFLHLCIINYFLPYNWKALLNLLSVNWWF